ncbi:hypothetical protein [Thermococcus alcaliphilus]|uniref:hypothetical protein n=1 Tax=Thermococcus alcaliphilus TaxID=139207 RepID=UPI00209084C3|nr:hypothetical protein [Thermococcus alcaliphilus]
MKKATCVFAVFLVFMGGALVSAGGFDEFGYNYKARLFNGWYGYYDRSIEGGWVSGTGDAWLIMKWSKDWIPMEDEPVGAWVTNHWIWYSNDYNESTWYGWATRIQWNENTQPNAKYRIEEFMKIMKVSDDPEAWAEYEAGGAYSAGWGTYDSGVPKYVVFQDTIEVYDAETGELIATFDLCTTSPKGLGKPIF